jgi:hypothetical protein
MIIEYCRKAIEGAEYKKLAERILRRQTCRSDPGEFSCLNFLVNFLDTTKLIWQEYGP